MVETLRKPVLTEEPIKPMSGVEIRALGLSACPAPEWERDWIEGEKAHLGRRD